MDLLVGRRLNMALRVRDFSESNPSADPGFVSVLGPLKDATDRMVELASRHLNGLFSRHEASVNRHEIRRRLGEVSAELRSEAPELLSRDNVDVQASAGNTPPARPEGDSR